MTEFEEAEFSTHAKHLLANPVFLAALDGINADIGRELDVLKPDDIRSMQALVMLRQASTRIITHIMVTAESEKVTKFNALPKRGLFSRR